MSVTRTYPCLRCELRFNSTVELEDHLAVDHPPPLAEPATPSPEATATTEPVRPRRARSRLTVAVSPVQLPTVALPVAGALAAQARMALEIVEIEEPELPHAVLDEYIHENTQRAERRGATDVNRVRFRAFSGSVAATIVNHLDRTAPALACLSTRGRSAMSELVLGSISSAVVRQSAVPILLVHPDAAVAEHYERIVVGLDGSVLSEWSLAPAADLAERLGANLWLVQVAEPDLYGSETTEAAYLRRLSERLAHRDCEVGYEVLHGPVRDALAGAVDETSILALGTRGRSARQGVLLGSATQSVVRQAHCPVLVTGPMAQSAGDDG